MEQYQEQMSKLAQERAALNEANNPFKKFAGNVLSTLSNLAFGLSTMALTYGLFIDGLKHNPFGVAAAAFAAGVVLRIAAAKVGATTGAMSGGGRIDRGMSGMSGFSGQDRQQDTRPIIFVRIVGQTPGEAARDYMADVARYQNLGGRTPGVSANAATVNVPGVVVRMAG
jgi:hypothetical protein